MQKLVSVNPYNGKTIKSYPISSDKQIEQSIKKAHKAYKSWHRTSFKERAGHLLAVAKQLRLQQKPLAETATLEMGKPIRQSMDEVEKCARTFEFYAQNGAGFLKDQVIETDASKSYVSFQPLGVVLAVMPWNFPYWQVFRAMAPTLMAGNSMLLKHASNVSGCALAIEKIMKDAKVPEGLFKTLLIPSGKVEQIIAQPEIAAVSFTGSVNAGKKIAQTAAAHLKKQVLELGGSDPYIILADADIDLAVEVLYNGRLVNTGQSCVAAKRFIAVKEIRKAFEQKMLQRFKETSYGDPFDENNKIGPMSRADLRDELHRQVENTVQAGATLLCGGFIPEGNGAFYPPTILSNVKKGMPAYDEELFGPVATIIEAKNTEDAIRIANDTEFGLGAGIFSKNKKAAEAIAARDLYAGNCFVNAFVHSDPRLPFGGIKNSGYGRELGLFGIREFVNIKTVFIK